LLGLTLISGELGRIQITQAIYLHISNIAVVIFLLTHLKVSEISKFTVTKILVTATIGVFFTMIFTGILRVSDVPVEALIAGLLYPIRWGLYALLPIAVFQQIKREKETNSIRMLIWSVSILAVLGLIQLAFVPSLAFLEPNGYDPHYLRVVSTWLDPNYLGAALVMGMAALSSLYTENNKYKYVLLCIMFTALIGTFSRSSYLMFGITFATLFVLQKNWKGLGVVGGAALLITAIYIFPRTALDQSRNIDRQFSANLRMVSYWHAYTMFQDHPITGVGYNLIRYEKNERNQIYDLREGGNSGAGFESSWVTILAATGIVGFTVYLAYWLTIAGILIEPVEKRYSLIKSVRYIFTKNSHEEHVALTILFGWAVHACFVNSMVYQHLLVIWGIILGFVLSTKKS
jgi:O-antigen ligase